jgi:hypothetical protein
VHLVVAAFERAKSFFDRFSYLFVSWFSSVLWFIRSLSMGFYYDGFRRKSDLLGSEQFEPL